jgi:hypothetical protein
VLIIVIVTVSLSMMLCGIWAQNLVKEHRRIANAQFRIQATRLAEAGIRRAFARRAAEPQFTEETWSVPAESLGGAHAATVQIHIVPGNDGTNLRYEAMARFPADSMRRAQITKQIDVPVPPSENES